MRTQCDKCYCRARHRMWEHKERGTDTRVAGNFNRLLVADNWYILSMSSFPHLENGKATVLSSQPPPSRLPEEIRSQTEGRERGWELCASARALSDLSGQCRPGGSSLCLLCRKSHRVVSVKMAQGEASVGPRVSEYTPHFRERSSRGHSH